MLKAKVNFERICQQVTEWTWIELQSGVEMSIISYDDIIFYARKVLNEETEQFDLVLNLAIAEVEEIEELLNMLACSEEKKNTMSINSKWIFSIINDAYLYSYEILHEVIEDVYVKFDYPNEISNLISYMPSENGKSIEEEIEEYIIANQKVWIRNECIRIC